MSATPLKPPAESAPVQLPGGMVLPPLPDAEEAAGPLSSSSPESSVAPRSGLAASWVLLLSLLAGGTAGGGVVWWSGQHSSPVLENAEARLTLMEGTQRDLEAQLRTLRGQQLELERQLQETRQVVATITLEASRELKSAQQSATKAERELQQLKLETALNRLNQEFAAEGVPIGVTGGSRTGKQVSLTIAYWGFRVTEREALAYLQRFALPLRTAFPDSQFPADFTLTFRGAQNGRESVYRQGLWDRQESPSTGGTG